MGISAEHTDEYWDKVMSINTDAQFILGRVGKSMIEQGGGKIIFCSLLSFGGINVPRLDVSRQLPVWFVRLATNGQARYAPMALLPDYY
jgi:NAD(P)-dependent dehydrogenase (short-subunit alcohol dehydrogenase family)